MALEVTDREQKSHSGGVPFYQKYFEEKMDYPILPILQKLYWKNLHMNIEAKN